RWDPTADTLQFLGFTPDDILSERGTGRHRARVSMFARFPLGITGSVFYSYSQGNRSNVATGDFPLNAAAPTVTLSNGRVVSDPFFNPSYPLARRNDVNMIKADDVHVVNLRIEKSFDLTKRRRHRSLWCPRRDWTRSCTRCGFRPLRRTTSRSTR